MRGGVISQLNHDKGYGKIKAGTGEEAHFHKDCLWNTQFVDLIEGQDVEFEMQPSYQGHLAFQIRLVEHKKKEQEKERNNGRQRKEG